MRAAIPASPREPLQRRRIVFSGERVRIGAFRATPSAPWFEDSGPARGYLVVFPRTAVRITHAGATPVVADPSRVMFYNRGQEYRRERIAEDGDRCEWFAFSAEDLTHAIRRYDPRADERPERPFAIAHAPSDPGSYALQRILFTHAARGAPLDALAVEDLAMQLLERVLASAYGERSSATEGARHAHRALADAVRSVVCARLSEPLTLGGLARAVGASPFHLSRVFGREAGCSLHAYVDTLRLFQSLERIADGEACLTKLALDLGYASHSHFTFAFRKRFGIPPSHVRRVAARGQLEDLTAIAKSPRVSRARS